MTRKGGESKRPPVPKRHITSTAKRVCCRSFPPRTQMRRRPHRPTDRPTDRLNYFISEQTGTPVLALTGSGTVLENNRVLPFGELWNSESGSPNDQKFTTYDRESVSGLDYAMARFYASRYGRFTSADMSGANVDL